MMKSCVQCKQELSLTEYVVDKHSFDGLTRQCKPCRNAKKAEYRARSKDKIKAYQCEYDRAYRERKRQERQQHYAENKEAIDAERKERHQRNWLEAMKQRGWTPEKAIEIKAAAKERVNQKARQRYWDNHEAILAVMRKEYKNNPNVQRHNRIKKQRRKAIAMGLTATFVKQDWQDMLTYFNHQCAYCGSINDITQEHVIPASKGGHYTRSNVIPACAKCNLAKHNQALCCWYPNQPFFDCGRLARIVAWCG